jgi:pyruvate,water dikinase
MVVNGLDQREIGAHRAHFMRLQAEGDLATERLTKLAYKGLFGWVRGPLVARLIRVSRALSPLREHHKFLAVKFLALIKQVLLDAGEQLQAAGKLESADDIWFLTIPDVIEAFGNTEPLHSLIQARRIDFEHYKQLSPPRVFTSEGDIPIVKLDGGKAPEGALLGSPVSAGVVEGIAKVIHNPSVEVLAPGEILVASFTDPGWTPLFVNAVGLVTEVGGLMSHGSVIAREYGIPAVVGVVEATKQIKTGQRIRVQGAAGYIELLDDQLPHSKRY